MTRRLVAIHARPPVHAAPPGVDDAAFSLAMIEDVVDLVAEMQQVEAAVIAPEAYADVAAEVAWPGMPVARYHGGGDIWSLLTAVAALGADEIAVVEGDAPDLPALLIGKLFSALTSADVAVCPSADGGLVVVASRLPVPEWLVDVGVSADDRAAVDRLRDAAPRRALQVGPGWHRIRRPTDVAALDPGLEGWAATRALLGG